MKKNFIVDGTIKFENGIVALRLYDTKREIKGDIANKLNKIEDTENISIRDKLS